MGKRSLETIGVGALLIGASIITGGLATGPIAAWLAVGLQTVGVSVALGGLNAGLHDIFGEKQSQFLSNTVSAQAPLPIVYGRRRIGVTWVDFRQDPANKDVLYAVGALCLGPVHNITDVYFDDVVVIGGALGAPVVDGSLSTSHILSKYGGNKLKYAIHLGEDAPSADAELHAKFAAAWPSSSKGAGICYIVLRMQYDKDVYASGLPNVTCVVEGRTLFDPRDSSTAFSVNPALALRDFATNPRYGCAASAGEIDDDAIGDAANYCEETVNTTAYVGPRFTANGALDSADARSSGMEAILSACRGQFIYQGGKFRLRINQVETPSAFELNEDNIIGDWEFSRLGGIPNSITASYVDPDLQFQTSQITWPEAGDINGFLSDDNGFGQTVALTLPLTQNKYIAQQIGMVILRESRNDIVISVTAKQEAIKLQVGEVVYLTHSTPGFDRVKFRVGPMLILPDTSIRLALRLYTDEAYELDTQNTQDNPPATSLPDPTVCAAPTSLVLTSDATTALPTQDGQFVPRIHVAWTAADEPFLDHYEVRFKKAADSDYTPAPNVQKEDAATAIYPVTDAVDYTVEVRAVNALGVASVWVGDSVTVSTEAGSSVGSDLPAQLRQGTVDETGGVATDGVYVDDPDGVATLLQVAVSVIGSGISGRTTISVAPTDGVEYTHTAALIEGHAIQFIWYLTQVVSGVSREFTFISPIYDYGQIPDGTGEIIIDAGAATASAVLDGDSDADSWKVVLTKNSGYATLSTVRAATPVSGRQLTPTDLGALLTGLSAGDKIYLAALPIGPAGQEGTKLVRTTKQFGLTPATLESSDLVDNVNPASHKVFVRNPSGLAWVLEYRARVGGADFPTTWTALDSGTGDGDDYTESVATVEGHPSQIEWRLVSTLNGVDYVSLLLSPLMDLGFMPNISGISYRRDPSTGRIYVTASVDSDGRSAGDTIIGNIAAAGTVTDPTIGSHDFALADMRTGEMDTGYDSNPAEGDTDLLEISLVGIDPNGDEGESVVYPITIVGTGSSSSLSDVRTTNLDVYDFVGGPPATLRMTYSYSALLRPGDYINSSIIEYYEDSDSSAEYPLLTNSTDTDVSDLYATSYYKDVPGTSVQFTLIVRIYDSDDVLQTDRDSRSRTVFSLAGLT